MGAKSLEVASPFHGGACLEAVRSKAGHPVDKAFVLGISMGALRAP